MQDPKPQQPDITNIQDRSTNQEKSGHESNVVVAWVFCARVSELLGLTYNGRKWTVHCMGQTRQ